MPRQRNESTVYVATQSFMCEIDGEQERIVKGKTRVRGGHPLYERYRSNFAPVDTGVHYEVEQATAAPGEKRGAPPA